MSKFIPFKLLSLPELLETKNLILQSQLPSSEVQLKALNLEIFKRKADLLLVRHKNLNVLDLTQECLSQREAFNIIQFSKQITYRTLHKHLEILVNEITPDRTKMMNQLGYMICSSKKNRYMPIPR